MPRTYHFVQVDVFTDRIFGGNQLAVFLQPDGLSDAEMQAIAREMNLSETTFVFPPTTPEAAARVRIFTPGRELPFAGHPTVGTSWVLAHSGWLPKQSRPRWIEPGTRTFNLEEGIGLVPVRLEGDAAWMSHRDAEFGPSLANGAEIAEALGLGTADLLPDQPIRTGSTGASFLFVPLASPEVVDRATANTRELAQAVPGERIGVFVFAPDPDRGPNRVYSRMFASEAFGISEDAATGSASGPLGAYVAEQRLVCLTEPVEIVSLQGQRMGRPSTIRIRLELRDGRATGIQVGGGVVPVLEGELTLPE